MADKYESQKRGDGNSYASYYGGMDKTMRQKVALISSYLPASGRIADMGCGSGKGSFDIANLYPELGVIGVDISAESVKYCEDNHRRANLSFAVGDIADKLFEDKYLNAILNSSVLHHVTSFNSFDVKNVARLLDNQVAELGPGGILAIRDFVVPEGAARKIHLDLPEDSQKPSSAELFKIFCRDFKCADYPSGGVPYRELESGRPGWRRFEVDMRRATEFILRKDYRADWDVELLEEYLYFSQEQFEKSFEERGLRLLLSRPIYNQWIINNRWKGQAELRETGGDAVPFPATNYMIVGQKASGGVRLRSAGAAATKPSFLKFEHFAENGGAVWDLVSRPHPTVDVIPWFELGGEVYVYARADYPRPITQERDENFALEQLRTSGYMTEPVTFAAPESEDVTARIKAQLSALGIASTGSIEKGLEFLPSAGGSGEKVTQYFVKLDGPLKDAPLASNAHGFSSKSGVRALAAEQTLRAYCAGGMMDNRLELACFFLLRKLGRAWGPWIGDETAVRPVLKTPTAKFLEPKDTRFSPAPTGAGFLELRKAKFDETDRAGKSLAQVELEYILPKNLTGETLVTVPYAFNEQNELLIGVEERFLPACQKFYGTSHLYCAPAWRLSKDECAQNPERLAADKLKKDFRIETRPAVILGSGYMPSPGTSPETCTVFAVPVIASNGAIKFFRAEDLLSDVTKLRSGHLLTALYRLVHATST